MQTDDLLEAVEALTKVRLVKVETDDGYTWARADPRLQMLLDEIHATTGSGGGKGGLPSERMPLSPDVMSRAFQIATQIGDWCRLAGLRATRDPIHDLDAWHVTRLATADLENVGYIEILQRWAREIDAMFDRPRPVDITVACPVCGEKNYTDENGDVCAWPLKASTRPFRVECRSCGPDISWEGPEAMIELAEEIGVDVSEIRAMI